MQVTAVSFLSQAWHCFIEAKNFSQNVHLKYNLGSRFFKCKYTSYS